MSVYSFLPSREYPIFLEELRRFEGVNTGRGISDGAEQAFRLKASFGGVFTAPLLCQVFSTAFMTPSLVFVFAKLFNNVCVL